MRIDTPGGRDEGESLGLAIYGMCHAVAAWMLLFWYLWYRVPVLAARFEDAGMQLPLATRVVIAATTWFVRLLPFLVLLAVPIVALIGGAIVLWITKKRLSARSVLRAATPLILAVASLGTLAGAFAVWAMHDGIAQVERAGRAQPP